MSWKINCLRAFLTLYVIFDVVILTLITGGPVIGKSAVAVQMLDVTGDVPIDTKAPPLGTGVAVIIGVFYIYCLIRLFFALDRIMVSAHIGALAGMGTARTLRILGRSLIWLWVAVIGLETVLPIALFWHAIEAGGISVELTPFDLKVVFALVGVALLVIAQLAREADDMKQELDGVV